MHDDSISRMDASPRTVSVAGKAAGFYSGTAGRFDLLSRSHSAEIFLPGSVSLRDRPSSQRIRMNDSNAQLSGSICPDTEHRLVEAVGSRDSAAFEALIKKYQQPVLSFIYKYLGDRFASEDIAQEVFLRVYRAAPEFEPRGKVSTWIFRIAYNLCLNEIIRRRRVCLTADFDENEPAAAEIEKAGHDALKEELMDAVRQLPEKQRAALLLRVNEELPYTEISQVLAVSVSSVESLLFRARANLKRLLKSRLKD